MSTLSVELTMLLGAAILYFLNVVIASIAADIQNGVAWGLGNRDEIPAVPGWGGRAFRAQVNLSENLLIFVCLVLIVQTSGLSGDLSELGALLFLVSRVAYIALYFAGVKVLRSLAYFGGVIGMVMMIAQVV